MAASVLTCPRCIHPLPHAADQRFCPHCGLPGARHAAADAAPLELRIGGRTYRVLGRLAFGSICAIYRCCFDDGTQGVFKVARDPCANHLVANEAQVLRRLHAQDAVGRFTPFLPAVEASLAIDDHRTAASHPARRANILRMHEEIRSPDELFTLAEVRGHYRTGLDARHVAWIWRRLLSALGFAHLHGVVHAAVLPMHVLIEPRGHKLLLIDWCSATHDAGPAPRTTTVITGGHLDWYKRSGGISRPPTPALDTALAARCMIHLLGGDPVTAQLPLAVEPVLARHFQRCLAVPAGPVQGRDLPLAWKVLDDFDRLIAALWGPRRFVPLAMPARRSA